MLYRKPKYKTGGKSNISDAIRAKLLSLCRLYKGGNFDDNPYSIDAHTLKYRLWNMEYICCVEKNSFLSRYKLNTEDDWVNAFFYVIESVIENNSHRQPRSDYDEMKRAYFDK